MKENFYPKVLLASPQHDSKRYIWEKWVETIKNLTYPNYDIFLAENSKTDSFAKEIEKKGIIVKRIKNDLGVMHRIAESHNACRTYALENNYDFLFHLETDIIPPFDVIERLLNNKKLVCSASYDIFHGKLRQAMIQESENLDRYKKAYRTVSFVNEKEPLVFNGKTRQVYHAGLGCILIHNKVLKKIPFRYINGGNMSADTWFANDCFTLNIPIYVDTLIHCQHFNHTWLADINEI